MNIMFGELILYQCKKTWIFEVNYGQLQRRKKGNHCASYTLCLGVGRKKKNHAYHRRTQSSSIEYSSTFKKTIHVDTNKLKGLKAHDYHVFMHQILPSFVYMPSCYYLYYLGALKSLCKNIDLRIMNELKEEAIIIPCLSKKKFP